MSQHLPVLDRLDLVHGPTPFEHLPRLSAKLGGPQIYVRRDDCTGFAVGCNNSGCWNT